MSAGRGPIGTVICMTVAQNQSDPTVVAELSDGDMVEAVLPGGAVVVAVWRVSSGRTGYLALDADGGRCVTLREGDTVRVIVPASRQVAEHSPEPPMGTPVWWGGEWWVRTPGSHRYLPTVASRLVARESLAWADMVGAVPADQPGAGT